MKKKVCKLINGQFSWVLEVDGESIGFSGASSADYFEKHYRKLGYTVERYRSVRSPDSFEGWYLEEV